MAMRNKKFEYKMYFGGPNDPGIKWNGYESYWNNGTAALGGPACKTVGLGYFSIFQLLTHGRQLSMRFIMLVDLHGTAWIQT